MATEEKQAGYGGRYAQGFQLYVKLSQEHKAILQCLDYVLTGEEFERIGAGKSHLHVLGVGSGAGEIDTHVLSVLHSSFPDVPIAVDVVEPSTELTEQFKALLATIPQLQKMPFAWHTMSCAEYQKKVQDDGETKQFDLIHMVQMLYYVDDYAGTIKFFHSLLKKDGKLLIVHEGANTGWDILWKTYRKELCSKTISDYLSAGDIKVHLKSLGLQYVERIIPNTLDITDCFVQGSEAGELLLDFMTEQDHFHRSLTPELRAGILDLLCNKCSTVKDGRVLFDCSLSCIVISACSMCL